MPTKIRLQRHGKKGRPFYHIVVADSRAPRDGRFIERIGSYNPISNPATIDIDSDRATDWMMKGAQPTETARAILSYKGILYRVHLARGVAKGSLTQELADSKFETWMQEKAGKIDQKKSRLAENSMRSVKSRLEAEAKVNEARVEARKRKEAEEALALQATENTESAPEEEAPAEEAPAEEAGAAPEGDAPAEA